MARIRTIKPEFFTSEDIVSLSFPARLLYIALWCEADREGRLSWKPTTFKLRYFPGDKINIDACALELLASGLVIEYGQGLAYIPKFSQHQHINPREAPSNLPVPDASARVSDASAPVSDTQGGREGKERNTRRDAPAPSGAFLRFWGAWPKSIRKQAQGKCWSLWRQRDFDQIAPAILAHVEMLKQSSDWQNDGGAYVPAPLVYLNQRRWEGAEAVEAEPLKVAMP